MTSSGFRTEVWQREVGARWMGRAYRVVEETSSTIDLAWEWLREGGPDGGTVIAQRQTRGRGRLGREWASPQGGLWMSVIARPRIHSIYAGRLGIIMALASAQAISECSGCAARVKWPNDVVLGARKVGGVLVETQVAGEHIKAAVLSAGVNVNLAIGDLPKEVRKTTTTLLAETGRRHSLEAIAARALENLEGLWPALSLDGGCLAPKWREWDALSAAEVEIDVGGTQFRGQAAGIDEEGELILTTPAGVEKFASGEVRALRESRP